MTMVFVFMFAVIFIALTGLVNRTYHESVIQAQDEEAFQIAEAGLNYARWRLAHNPENYASETREVNDQLAGSLGEYDVSFTEPTTGSTAVTITSVGQTAALPHREVTLKARYGRPSLAQYSAVYNDDYWFGPMDVLHGVVHANGGIRMDGTSDSKMTSAKETYTCKWYHGCGSGLIKPGVWGAGQIQELWEYPVAPVNYAGLTLDLLNIQEVADEAGSYYDSSHAEGYHLVLNENNTYTVYRVTEKAPKIWSKAIVNGVQKREKLSHDIAEEEFIETKDIPDAGALYFEDTLWIEGHVHTRVTVGAGVFPDANGTNVDVIINGSLTYDGVKDGSRALGVIAQRDILIPWSGADDVLEMNGAFVAQKGGFGRRFYENSGDTAEHAIKTSLTIYGMIAMNVLTVDVTWVGGSDDVTSGYPEVTRSYDYNFRYAPPPYFPTSGQYEFISWEEEQ
ncbi:MAG: hypothetical protein U1C49_01340 [Candidatus Andersenbacteria bacterium]|nr:hypothetical protein [bacterium]MDZ4225470.1 hypothetical protein [Candidatus Andersenbacteria bacterium]